MENPMKQKDVLREPTKPTSNPVQEKRSNTVTALIALAVPFILMAVTIVIFNHLKISLLWLIALIIFVILLIPSIWSYAVSPSEISEQGALSMFDKILRRLNILSLLIKPDKEEN